jgi:hypothetical protein
MTAQQSAGAAALIRAGKSGASFQSPPSVSSDNRPDPRPDAAKEAASVKLETEGDEKLATELQAKGDIEDRTAFESKKAAKAAENPGASGGGLPMTAQKKQAAKLKSLKKKIDAAMTSNVDIGKALTGPERIYANTAQIGDVRRNALIEAGVIMG